MKLTEQNKKMDELDAMIQSLKLYHRISNEKLSSGEKKSKDIIEKIYIDPLPNDTVLKKMLKKETTFLVGKKGTGKSTIIERAQYQIRVDKKSLLYI